MTWLPRIDGSFSGVKVTAFVIMCASSRAGWIHSRSGMPSTARTTSASNGAWMVAPQA